MPFSEKIAASACAKEPIAGAQSFTSGCRSLPPMASVSPARFCPFPARSLFSDLRLQVAFAFDEVLASLLALGVALDHREFLRHVEGGRVVDCVMSASAVFLFAPRNWEQIKS
jgi:hypothetical protein